MNKLDLYPFTMIPLNIGENLSKSIEKVRNKIILMKKSINNFNETSYNSFSLSKASSASSNCCRVICGWQYNTYEY